MGNEVKGQGAGAAAAPQTPLQKLVQYDYVVLPGDTSLKIAERFGCLPAWVLEANKLKDDKGLTPGRRIKVPVAVPIVSTAWARGRKLAVFGERPFGGRSQPTIGMIHASVIDRGNQGGSVGDELQFCHATFVSPQGGTATVAATGTARNAAFGGVGLLRQIHGDTGHGFPQAPRSLAYLAAWGAADVFRDGKRVAGSAPLHVSVIPGDSGRLQFDLVVGPDSNLNTPGGFLHLRAAEVDLALSL